MNEILHLIDQHTSLITLGTSAEHKIGFSVMFIKFRITHMLTHTVRIILIAHQAFFVAQQITVFTCDKHRVMLSAFINVIIGTIGQLHISRIIEVKLIVMNISTAGISTAQIIAAIRKQNGFFLFPCAEILCRNMTPQLDLAFDVKGRILIINMIYIMKLT